MRKILEQCPTCEGELSVTRLECETCHTVISSRYAPCRFCRLTPDDLHLFETFVRCRGNVKEMERALGESYWTVRAKLDQLIQSMGFEAAPSGEDAAAEEPGDPATERLNILDRLDKGEINVSEATRLLGTLQGADTG